MKVVGRHNQGKTMYSVLVVSNFRLIREAVRVLIEGDQRFLVIAEADDRSHTLQVVSDIRPDLILFDLDPDYAAGVETIRQLIKCRPGIRILAISRHTEDVFVESALRAGVRGFLCKSGSSGDLAAVLQVVAEGGAYLSPNIMARVMGWVKNREVMSTPNPALAGLTEREVQVLTLLAEGQTSKDVASTLNLAVETVHSYRKSLMKKLDLHNVAAVAHFAARVGLLAIVSKKEPE